MIWDRPRNDQLLWASNEINATYRIPKAQRGLAALRKSDVVELSLLHHRCDETDRLICGHAPVDPGGLEQIDLLRPTKGCDGPLHGRLEGRSTVLYEYDFQ